jgi:hypothetical protein
MKITFNTHRLYSPEGQIITAAYDRETQMVTFEDHTRMIAGEFEYSGVSHFSENDPRRLARCVMLAYDGFRYQATSHELPRQDEVFDFRF